MTVGRGKEALEAYKSLMNKDDRREMARDATCDEQAAVGYLRAFQAVDFGNLNRLRLIEYPRTVAGRFQRKADYYNALARMANRREKIKLP